RRAASWSFALRSPPSTRSLRVWSPWRGTKRSGCAVFAPIARSAVARSGPGAPERGTRDSAAMTAALDELVRLFDLEPIEVNIFRGRSPAERQQRVFGGQ